MEPGKKRRLVRDGTERTNHAKPFLKSLPKEWYG